MKKAILAKKVGMTQIFDENGVLTPVTVLQAGPVLQQCSQHITSVSFHAACKAAFFTWNLRHSDTVTY